MSRRERGLLVSFAGAVAVFVLAAQVTRRARSDYAYFFDCSGSYIKLSVSTQKLVSEGSIWDNAVSIRPTETERFDGCLVSEVHGDPEGALLYLVVPVEGTIEANGTRHYRVAELQLPALSLSEKRDLDLVAISPPKLLINQRTAELWAVYSTEGVSSASAARRDIIERYKIPGLKPVGSTRSEIPEDKLAGGVYFTSDRPYWGSWHSSETIIDGDRILNKQGRLAGRGEFRSSTWIRPPGRCSFVSGGTPQRPLTMAAGCLYTTRRLTKY